VALQQWEHRVVHTATSSASLQDELVRLGAQGWEAIGITGVDKTIGINALMAIVKRQIVPPPPLPDGTAADWYDDPCGRWERRHWDGTAWTAHVANIASKARGIDPPQTLPPSD
jgi:hypothetical protein